MERTLDDSANRRIVIGQAFLAIDAVLNLYMNVSENLVVNDKVIEKHIKEELPFMATENIMMACVKAGGNRQELHEKIRELSMQASYAVKKEGKPCNVIELIKNDNESMINPNDFVGRSPQQVIDFVECEVKPIIEKNKKELGATVIIEV